MKKFMGVLVAIIVVMVVLIPITSEMQKTAGAPILFANSGAQTGARGGYNEFNSTVTYEVTSDGITINGNAFSYSSVATWGAVIIGENGTFEINASRFDGRLVSKEETTSNVLTTVGVPYAFTLDGSVLTIGEYSLDMGKGFYLDTTGDYSLAVGLTVREGTWYVNDISDVTAYGVYTTGENDTKYSFVNGVVKTAVDYESSASYTLTKVDGTTDVYTLNNFMINIGGEEFTPYNSVIIKDCYGHKESGISYTILGIIPVFVLLGVILAITMTFMFGSKNELTKR